VFVFSITLTETSVNISLTIRRMKGTFDDVAVYCYADGGGINGASRDLDFKFSPRVSCLVWKGRKSSLS